MTRIKLNDKIRAVLGTDTPITIDLDPEKIEFLILYKHGLIQYMSPKEFSWISGSHEDTIHKKIENRVYPYHLFFTKPLGSGRYRMHVSRVSSLMSGEGVPGDTRNKKRRLVGKQLDVAHPPMSRHV